MRTTLQIALLAALPLAASAQDTGTVAVPPSAVANYDPTLSAKEAALANWDLAASGIRAGEVVGARVVSMADNGASYARLTQLAEGAQRTMLQRWNAAQWIYGAEQDLPVVGEDALRAVAAAVAAECDGADCAAEAAALRDAFAEANVQLATAAAAARGVVEARVGGTDAALLAEQLGLVSDYLGGGAWGDDLVLTEFGLDGEVVAARIVGALSIWRNLEPYVGLASPEIDDAINEAAEQLLRTLRLETRLDGPLAPDGPQMTALRDRAGELAEAFGRAADLFPTT